MTDKHTEAAATAKIRNNETGEVRDYPTTIYYSEHWPGEQPEPDLFIWTDGNFACDCNRGLFFGYAAGLGYEEIPHECGDSKFSVNLIDQSTGRTVHEEWPVQNEQHRTE